MARPQGLLQDSGAIGGGASGGGAGGGVELVVVREPEAMVAVARAEADLVARRAVAAGIVVRRWARWAASRAVEGRAVVAMATEAAATARAAAVVALAAVVTALVVAVAEALVVAAESVVEGEAATVAAGVAVYVGFRQGASVVVAPRAKERQ